MGRYEYHVINLNDDLYLFPIVDRVSAFFEITVDYMEIDPKEARSLFVMSGLAEEFERQNPVYVLGKTEYELVEWALERCGMTDLAQHVPTNVGPNFGPTGWIGSRWAYFQMKTGMPYHRIMELIPYDTMELLYYRYGECDFGEVFPVLDKIVQEKPWVSQLKTLRKGVEMTQAELSARSGVSLRAIQQYEQGAKDIRKASADTVYRLSRVLYCTMEDLIL